MATFATAHNEINELHKQHGTDHSGWLEKRYIEVKNDIKPELKEAVEVLSQQINSWGNVPYLEIEARIGFFDDDDEGQPKYPFDTDISKSAYEKICAILENDREIIKKEHIVSTDYIKGSCRMSIDHKDSSRHAIKKDVLEQMNFRYDDSSFDLRISFSMETPISIEQFENIHNVNTNTRKKDRKTYHTKHWKYDLTKVDTTTDTGCKKTTRQIEIEAKLSEIPYVDYVYMAETLLLKVQKNIV